MSKTKHGASKSAPVKKPTPDEIAQLRALFPKGAPRIDYRDAALVIGRAPLTDPDAGAGEVEEPNDSAAEDAAESSDNPVIPIAFSSEAPVLRYDWWDDETYYEVLDHSAKSVILDYATDGLPFVASHRSYDADQQHGLVENIVIGKDRTLRGDVKMSRAQRSQEIAADMRDGIRKKVSVGYIVGDQYDQTKAASDGIPIRRYTAWMPIEVSTVPVPADYSVGTGRAQSADGQHAIARFLQLVPPSPSAAARSGVSADLTRSPSTNPQAPAAEEHSMDSTTNVETTSGSGAAPSGDRAAPTVNVSEITERANLAAATRIKNITDLATQHACTDKLTEWIGRGTSESEVIRDINTILADRLKNPTVEQAAPIKVSEKDKKRFSFARALIMNTELQKEVGPKVDFGFEREMMQEVQRSTAQQKGGNLLPFALIGGRSFSSEQSNLRKGRAGIDSGTASTGGPFKFAQPGDFIPVLRNKSSVMRAGATVIPGLTGPLTMPKQLTATGTVYSAENPGSDITVTNLTASTLTLAFKSLAAGTAFSRQMLFSAASGNYDLEAIVENDIAAVIGLAMDLGALAGSGASNQPQGLLSNTNIGSVTLGANGGTMAWGSWVDLETAIGDANADTARMAYITNTKQRGVAKKSAVLGNTATGAPIWSGTPDTMDGVVNGYRAIASNQVPRNLTKGTAASICSAVIFGAFEHQLIGIFGNGYETIVDPYSKKYQGMVEVTAWTFFDAAQRYDGAFAAVKDAL